MATAKYRIQGEDATAAAFRSALGNAKKTADAMKGVFTTAFAGISLASIIGVGRSAIQAGDDLKKFADKARLSGEQASSLAYAAKLADVELEGLGSSMQKMSIFLSKASDGTKSNVETLAALGLEYSNLKDLRPDEQLELIADAISHMGSEADQQRAEVEIFGKSGGQLHDMFMRGAEGIREARGEAEKLGLLFSDQQLAQMAKVDESINRLSASWEHFAGVITAKVAPGLSWTFDRLSGMPLDINEQIANLEDMIQRYEALASMVGKGPQYDEFMTFQRQRLAMLKKVAVDQSMREMGVVTPGTPAGGARPPGYAASAAGRTAQTEDEKRADAYAAAWESANEYVSGIIQEGMDENLATELEHVDQATKRRKEAEDELDQYRSEMENERMEALEDQRMEFSAMWADVFLDGRDGWDNLLDYWKRRLLTSGIDKLLGMLFSQEGGRFPSVGRVFGFARGGRPPPGVPYIVGEEGPELRIDGPGSIVPNDALGGVNFSPVTHIDARGASMDLVRALPEILRKNNQNVMQEFSELLRRRRFRFN